jgi:hypothetical protein
MQCACPPTLARQVLHFGALLLEALTTDPIAETALDRTIVWADLLGN